MNDKNISTFELDIINRVNQILPDIFNSINMIEKLPVDIGQKILSVLIQYACVSTHMTKIVFARNQIKVICKSWLIENLPKVSKTTICYEDEWEYRRLLELVEEVAPELLEWTISQGINSTNDSVREAAEDFKGM